MNAKPENTHIRPLEHLNGQTPPAPDWFTNNLGVDRKDATIEVNGSAIHYSTWGSRGKPGLLFVHGGRAHRRWWFPFAPFFTDQYRVAALDLSGLGDSDWRERYSLACHADEIFAVCEAAELGVQSRPIVVGHSFGGWVTLGAVEMAGEMLGGAIVIDSPFGVPDPDEGYTIKMGKEDGKPMIGNRVYPALAEPISRFRFLPNQPCDETYLVDYIARNGLRPVENEVTGEKGFSWKFDPEHGKNFDIHFDRDVFLVARCPLAFIYGEQSLFAQGDGFDHIKKQARGRSPCVIIPQAHHHLMMEQPLAFVSAVKALLTCWPVRVGF